MRFRGSARSWRWSRIYSSSQLPVVAPSSRHTHLQKMGPFESLKAREHARRRESNRGAFSGGGHRSNLTVGLGQANSVIGGMQITGMHFQPTPDCDRIPPISRPSLMGSERRVWLNRLASQLAETT